MDSASESLRCLPLSPHFSCFRLSAKMVALELMWPSHIFCSLGPSSWRWCQDSAQYCRPGHAITYTQRDGTGFTV
uniref:Uncharacterized protein n=1 Tax=Arundo donax TaxID=35708 RepID=A0A0A9CB29_ARUDO